MKKINVLHIVSGNINMGAAKGANLLHNGLIKLGVNSWLLNNGNNFIDDKYFYNINNSLLNRIINFFLTKSEIFVMKYIFRRKKNYYFSSGSIGIEFTKLDIYKNADIIHLHWINAGLVNISIFNKIDKPVVWTIRDMWPMTGGCHYSLNCSNYKNNCSNCPQIKSIFNIDFANIIQKRKEKYYNNNIHFVAISNWVRNQAHASRLLKSKKISYIQNCIDTKEFFRLPKEQSLLDLGIKTSKKIILIGAINLENEYKGFEKFIDLLNFISKDNFFILTFGNCDDEIIKEKGFEYLSLGFVKEIYLLRKIYSASDVFVFPSTYEAFGKTVVESMACGTPVVAFNNSGPRDIIDHKVNGYLAKPFSVKDLQNGINWVINNPNSSKKSILKSKDFDIIVAAKKYQKLYSDILV